MASKREVVTREWHDLFRKCLRSGVSARVFGIEARKKVSRNAVQGKGILLAWARSHDGSAFLVLPRLKEYLVQLLELDIVSDPDAISYVAASVKTTLFHEQDSYLIKSGGAADGEWKQCLEAAILECLIARIIHLRDRMVRSSSSSSSPRGDSKVFAAESERTRGVRIYNALVELLLPAYTTAARGLDAAVTIVGPAYKVGEELGRYVLAYVNYLSVIEKLTANVDGAPEYCKEGFGRTLPPFIAVMTTASSNELAESLALLQRQAGFFEKQNSEENVNNSLMNDFNALTFQQNIVDIPPAVTRAGLYIYLNAMLTGRPLCGDAALFTFLNSRYHGTVDTLIADLITASFDVLANAINRTEPADSINVYRSFLINKLPVLLESFSGMIYPPQTVESCISDALSRMDPSADPFSTQSFDLLSSSGMLSEARQEFLFACALYNLIPESSIETILGDVPMQSLPESGKYSRAVLVQQCTANSSRIEELIGELENMEGNSAEIAAALVELIHTLCISKDSLTLKLMCNTLSKNVRALDVILLFAEPRAILQPLCNLIDHWQDAEDQNESHPVYDEFGSILLLILVFWQHFNLQLSDLGINYPDSFVREYLRKELKPIPSGELSEAQRQRLGEWIKGLYESEGISDELMSTCSPKDFHLLVPTLFDQSLKVIQAGILNFDAMKGGFELLLEPFLIPSLVAGLGWATRRLWETQPLAPHLDHLLPILTLLLRPATLSADSTPLHEAVLSITAKPLERALAHVQKLHPRRQDIDPLLNTLKSRVQPTRSAAATSHTELETWCCAQGGGGFPATIRHTLRALVAWSATGSHQSAPPQYSHRQLLMSVQMLGAPATLSALLDEASRLLSPDSNISASVVLDVLSALICAPHAAHGRCRLLDLRQALRLAHDQAYALSKSSDPARATLVVRLQRRVDAQSLVVTMVGGGGGGGAAPDGAQVDGDGQGAAAAAAAAAAGDMLAVGGGGGDYNMDTSAMGAGGGGVHDDGDLFGL